MRDLAILILSIGASAVMVIGILLVCFIAYRTMEWYD